jgi:recombinational DNA repair protein RecT
MDDFEKAKKAAQSNDFWGKHPKEMQFKTLVNRVTSRLPIDPRKINDSYKAAEADDNVEARFEEELAVNANTGEIIDVQPDPGADNQPPPADQQTPPRGPGF